MGAVVDGVRSNMRKTWLRLLWVVLGGSLVVWGAEPEEIQRAIGQLGHASYEVRDKASRYLWSLGKAAEPALLEASKSRDPEVAARAREILGDFRCGIRPETPPDIVQLIRQYRHGRVETKQRVVAVMMQMGQRGYPFLVRLWSVETDVALRGRIYQELARHLSQTACAFVAEGDLATTEELLEAGATEGTEPATRYWAVYCLLQGKAEERIQQLRTRLERDSSPQAARALMYLYRAKGDWAGARWAAEKMGETDLLKEVLFEMGEWKALAVNLRRVVGDGPDLRTLTLLTTLDRLAGNQEDLERDLALLPQHAEGSPEQAREAARAFLLNDRVEEALALFAKHGQAAERFEILWAQQRYKEAMELTEKVKEEDEASVPLQCEGARLWNLLGEREKAAAGFEKVVTKLMASGEMEMLRGVIAMEMSVGLADQAIEHAAKAMAKVGAERGPWYLSSLFMENAGNAAAWRTYFRNKHPQEDEVRVLRRVHALLDGQMTAEEMKALAEEAMRGAAQMNPITGRHQLALVAETMLERGQEALAQAAYEQLVAQSDAPEYVMALAGLMLKRQQWQRAAELYGLAIEKDRGSAAARYLRGWALAKAGQEKQGKELMAMGTLLPLGSEEQRQQLIEALKEAGLEREAAEQNELLRRTAAFGSEGFRAATLAAATEAQNRGDGRKAALYWQTWLLEGPRRGWLTETTYALTQSNLIHRLRAAELLKEGKAEEAMKEIALCQKLMPGQIELAIDLMGLLEKAGKRPEAEALFKHSEEAARRLCEAYPRSAQLHNNLAWLLARCRRDLDRALAHAQKGVELEPRNTAILDTLAEVHFQRGEKQKAMEAMQRCIELEPRIARHRVALKRIEEGEAGSEPPPG